MNSEIRFSYAVENKDHLEAMLVFSFKSVFADKKVNLFYLFTALFVIVNYFLMPKKFNFILMVVGIGYPFFLIFFVVAISYFDFKRRKKLRGKEDKLTDLQCTDEELTLKGADAEFRLKWTLFKRFFENKKYFLLCLYDRRNFFIVPKKAFANPADV